MKVLVCGGRGFRDRVKLETTLDALHERYGFTCVVTGAYRGADSLAEQWARSRAIKYVGVPANWQKHYGAAGPIRNQRMLDEEKPDMVIAFLGGSGTADMIAVAAGLFGQESHDVAVLRRE